MRGGRGAGDRLAQRVATVFLILAVPVAVLFIVVWVTLSAVSGPRDGDRIAAERVEQAAAALLEMPRRDGRVVDGETIAAERFTSRAGVSVTPLSWSGTTAPGDAVVIEARLSAEVAEHFSGALYGPSNSAGAAERCFRFRLSPTTPSRHDHIPCAGLSASATPPVSNRPRLPADASEQVEAVLAASPPEDVADDLRGLFSDLPVNVQSTVTEQGELVVAVGIPGTKECVLRVRGDDGSISAPSHRPIWLEPGELGCSVHLYTSPPR